MSTAAKPVWPLVLMLVWYGLLLIGSGGMFVLGLAFGSEAYRDKPIPIEELAIITGPLLVTAALLAATLYCWNTDRQRAAYGLCGASVIAAFGLFWAFGVGIAI